ncbi:hypothetical protein AVEN_203801-1, partial [Araneus ventricosus]
SPLHACAMGVRKLPEEMLWGLSEGGMSNLQSEELRQSRKDEGRNPKHEGIWGTFHLKS